MKKHLLYLLTMMFVSLLIAGCKEVSVPVISETSVEVKEEGKPFEVAKPGTYDSMGTAIVLGINENSKTITFYDYELGKSYTLNYDGITRFSDRYDTAMSVGQVRKGSIVDLCFLKSNKTLVSLKESDKSFEFSDVTGFEMNISGKTFKYNNNTYRITKDTVLISDNGKLSLNDVYGPDKLTITGIDNNILSIVLEEGHGYLSLKGYEYFIGGFLEIGSKQIEKISDKMLVTVSEGTYDVKISHKGTEAVKQVEINSGEETVLDLSDIKIEEVKTGKVLFVVNPSNATLYVDGNAVDHSKLLAFEYGMHQLAAKCSGYESITRYFNVGSETGTLTVNLEEVKDSSKETEVSKTDGHFVYVTSPADVEVYVDNVFIGMSPVVFAKTAGTHTITLRKTGYETRSFNVVLENTAEDVKYAFDNLAKEEQKENTGSADTETSTEDSSAASDNSNKEADDSAASENSSSVSDEEASSGTSNGE